MQGSGPNLSNTRPARRHIEMEEAAAWAAKVVKVGQLELARVPGAFEEARQRGLAHFAALRAQLDSLEAAFLAGLRRREQDTAKQLEDHNRAMVVSGSQLAAVAKAAAAAAALPGSFPSVTRLAARGAGWQEGEVPVLAVVAAAAEERKTLRGEEEATAAVATRFTRRWDPVAARMRTWLVDLDSGRFAPTAAAPEGLLPDTVLKLPRIPGAYRFFLPGRQQIWAIMPKEGRLCIQSLAGAKEPTWVQLSRTGHNEEAVWCHFRTERLYWRTSPLEPVVPEEGGGAPPPPSEDLLLRHVDGRPRYGNFWACVQWGWFREDTVLAVVDAGQLRLFRKGEATEAATFPFPAWAEQVCWAADDRSAVFVAYDQSGFQYLQAEVTAEGVLGADRQPHQRSWKEFGINGDDVLNMNVKPPRALVSYDVASPCLLVLTL